MHPRHVARRMGHLADYALELDRAAGLVKLIPGRCPVLVHYLHLRHWKSTRRGPPGGCYRLPRIFVAGVQVARIDRGRETYFFRRRGLFLIGDVVIVSSLRLGN